MKTEARERERERERDSKSRSSIWESWRSGEARPVDNVVFDFCCSMSKRPRLLRFPDLFNSNYFITESY